MKKKIKNAVLIMMLLAIAILVGFLIYSELESVDKNYNFNTFKDYIAIHFKSSRMIFQLNSFANSTG